MNRETATPRNPLIARRMVAGLAGLAIGLTGLSTAGLAAAAPAIQIENPDVVPFPDRIVMNKVQNGTDDVTENDVGEVRIVNSGDQALTVTGLSLTGPFQLVAPPALPASIAPGANLVVSVLFTATGEGPNGGPHDGALTIASNGANAPTRVVELSGFWQINSGGSNEGTLEEYIPTFGYRTVIVGPGQKLQEKGRIHPVGDEVIAPFWTRMDPSQPVTVRQLGAFHNPSSDTFSWFPKGSPGQVKTVLTQLKEDYQTLLPRRSGDMGPGLSSFTPTSVSFGFKLASKWSDQTLNPKTESCVAMFTEANCGHAVRFWPIKDRAGVPVAGQYLGTMDFAEVSSGNYDYQDNFYLISNVVPEGTAVDATAPTLTARTPAPSATSVDAGGNITAAFSEAMHPASISGTSFTVAPTAGGTPVPATVTLSGDGVTATLDPTAALAAGTSYTATVTAGASDMAGNALAAAETWTFTTAGSIPGPGPGPGPVPARAPAPARAARAGPAAPEGPAAPAATRSRRRTSPRRPRAPSAPAPRRRAPPWRARWPRPSGRGPRRRPPAPARRRRRGSRRSPRSSARRRPTGGASPARRSRRPPSARPTRS